MQFSPPLCGPGYPNFGQFYYSPSEYPDKLVSKTSSYHLNIIMLLYFSAFPQNTAFPEIIGEGEVASVVFPDGSIHLYFIPLNKRFHPSYQPNSSYNPYFNNNMGAYYVRSISNP